MLGMIKTEFMDRSPGSYKIVQKLSSTELGILLSVRNTYLII